MIIKILFILFTVVLAYMFFVLMWKEGQKKEAFSLGAVAAWSVVVCAIDIILIALCLALIGKYSLLKLTAGIFIEAVITIFYIGIKKIPLFVPIAKSGFRSVNWILAGILLVAALLYVKFPTTYLWIRRDPGIYLLKGVTISENGGADTKENVFVKEHYNEINEFADIVYRGYYSPYLEGDSEEVGTLVSQFLPAFPAALAVGYSLFGLRGLLAVNAVIGILCLLALYYTCVHFFDWKVATIACLLLFLNPAQLWCARIPQTELLFQLFFISASYVTIIAFETKKAPVAIAAGLLTGFIGLIRLDSYIIAVAVTFTCLYYVVFCNSKRKTAIIVAYATCLSVGISLYYTYSTSKYYFLDHWNGKINLLIAGIVLLTVIITLVFLAEQLFKLNFDRFNILKLILEKPISRNMTFMFLLLLFFSAYFLRPHFQKGLNVNDDFNQRALIEFCWYITIPAVIMFFAGIYSLMKDFSKIDGILPFLVAGSASVLLYTYKPSIAPDHIWASRRWVSVAYLFTSVISAYGIVVLANRLKPLKRNIYNAFEASVTVLILGIMIYNSKAFILTPMLSEIQGKYNALAGMLDSNEVYYADSPMYASTLQNLYHRNVLVFNPDGLDQLEKYINKTQKPVYYIGQEPKKVFDERFSLRTMNTANITGTYLKQENAKMSRERIVIGQETNIYEIWPSDMTCIKDISSFKMKKWYFEKAEEQERDEKGQKKQVQAFDEEPCEYIAHDFVSGTYRMELSLDGLSDNDDPQQLIKINTGKEGTLVPLQVFSKTGVGEIVYEFSLSRKDDVIVEIPADLSCNDISCKYVSNNTVLFADCRDEINELRNILGKSDSSTKVIYADKAEDGANVDFTLLEQGVNRRIGYKCLNQWEQFSRNEDTIIITPYDAEAVWNQISDMDIMGRSDHYIAFGHRGNNSEETFMSDDGWISADFFSDVKLNTICQGKYYLDTPDGETYSYVSQDKSFYQMIFEKGKLNRVKREQENAQLMRSIFHCYEYLLQRQASDPEYEGWENYINQGNAVIDMLEKFLLSSEFNSRYTHPNDVARYIFEILYDRAPKQEETTIIENYIFERGYDYFALIKAIRNNELNFSFD